MTDLQLHRDTELMIAHIEAETEHGIAFVDAYLPDDAEIVVIDSGRVILPEPSLPAFLDAADRASLTVEEVS